MMQGEKGRGPRPVCLSTCPLLLLLVSSLFSSNCLFRPLARWLLRAARVHHRRGAAEHWLVVLHRKHGSSGRASPRTITFALAGNARGAGRFSSGGPWNRQDGLAPAAHAHHRKASARCPRADAGNCTWRSPWKQQQQQRRPSYRRSRGRSGTHAPLRSALGVIHEAARRDWGRW